MNDRKGLRLVQSITHESTERTQGRAESEQLLAVLDISEETFNEWRQLMRTMRKICPEAEDLTFDELSALAQRQAKNYERLLVSNGPESDDDAELLELTDTVQAPIVLTTPVDQVRGLLPNVQRVIPSYLYSAAITALFCGLILVVYINFPFQHVDDNAWKEITVPTPPFGPDTPKLVIVKIETSPPTKRPPRRREDKPKTQEMAAETQVAAMEHFAQVPPATATPTVQASPVSSSEPQQDSKSIERVGLSKFGLGSRNATLTIEESSDRKLTVSGGKTIPSSTPSRTPKERQEHGKSHTGGANGM